MGDGKTAALRARQEVPAWGPVPYGPVLPSSLGEDAEGCGSVSIRPPHRPRPGPGPLTPCAGIFPRHTSSRAAAPAYAARQGSGKSRAALAWGPVHPHCPGTLRSLGTGNLNQAFQVITQFYLSVLQHRIDLKFAFYNFKSLAPLLPAFSIL